jgi:hypothetical protein
MPKRIIDGEALWTSQKLKNVPYEYRLHYAMWIPLAEANGCFEASVPLIKSKVYSFLFPDIELQTIEDILTSFCRVGLINLYNARGKKWGFFVGIDKPGRLPSKKHLDRYQNLPPGPMDIKSVPESPGPGEDKTQTKPIQNQTKPFGHSPGLEYDENQKKDLYSEEEMSSLIKEIRGICIKYFGAYEPLKQMGDPTVEVLNEYAEAFGRQFVIDSFEDFIKTQGSDIGPYPIRKFLHYAPDIFKGKKIFKPDDMLQNLLEKIIRISGSDVTFSAAQLGAVKDLLDKYGEKDFLLAYRDFYSRIQGDDFQLKNAGKQWAERGEQFIMNLNIARERQQERNILAGKLEKLGREQVDKVRQEREKKEKEEMETEVPI